MTTSSSVAVRYLISDSSRESLTLVQPATLNSKWLRAKPHIMGTLSVIRNHNCSSLDLKTEHSLRNPGSPSSTEMCEPILLMYQS